MRKLLIAGLSAMLVLAACGGADDAPEPEPGQEEPAAVEEAEEPAAVEEADEPSDDEPAGRDYAALSGPLAVATYGGPTESEWQESFGEPFQEEAPNVDFALAGVPNPSSLAFTQEGDEQFDLLLMTGTNVAQIMNADNQLYTPIDPSSLERAEAVYEDLIITDDDGNWAAVPTFVTFYGIVTNTELVEPGTIQSWADLADPQFENRLLLNSPFFFATTDLPMFALANGGSPTDLEPGLELLEEVLPNARGTIQNLAEAASQMASGEIAVSPFYFSQYSQLVDGDAPVEFTIPEEGAFLSPLYLMIVRDSDNAENALAFIDLVLRADRQEAAGEGASYVPVVRDADLIDKLSERSGFSTTEELLDRLVRPDFAHLAATQSENTQRIEDILAR